jgi:predicted regulator of Ras-like GTPase activity (Roadblock/LC7/MglB family)
MEKELTANEYLKQLADRPGVSGYVVFNYEGIPMRNTMPDEKAVHYAA